MERAQLLPYWASSLSWVLRFKMQLYVIFELGLDVLGVSMREKEIEMIGEGEKNQQKKKSKAKRAPLRLSEKKPLLVIKTMELNLLEMANASCVSFNQLLSELKDGRVCSRYTEHWSADLFGFEKHQNTNQKDSDGAFPANELGEREYVSVKCLTASGVKFQNSKDVGAGRKCDRLKLLEAINATQKIMVVDITMIPTVRLIPLDSSLLARWVKEGKLGVSGVKRRAFEELLRSAYDEVREEAANMGAWEKTVRDKNEQEALAFYAARALSVAAARPGAAAR